MFHQWKDSGMQDGTHVDDQGAEPAPKDLLPPVSGGWPELVAHAEALGPDPLVADVGDRGLEAELRTCAAQVAATSARLLVLIGELVVRGIWHDGGGATTPGQWLSWAIGMAPSTAREQVRVALALRVFTATRERFLAGQVSYSKVRAITRAGEPGLEDMLLQYADAATAAQLERIVRTFRGLADDPTAHDRRSLSLQHADDGMVDLRMRVPRDVGAHVASLLERLVGELDASGQPHDIAVDPDCDPASPARMDPISARRADALVHGMEVAVAHLDRDLTGADRTTMVLHGEVDTILDRLATDTAPRDQPRASAGTPPGASAGTPTGVRHGHGAGNGGSAAASGNGGSAGAGASGTPAGATRNGGGGLPGARSHGTDASVQPHPGPQPRTHPERHRHSTTARTTVVTDDRGGMLALSRAILRRLACDPALCRITTQNGLPIDVGHTTRAISTALRRALRNRDATCRFPGCAATRHLHAHHIIHWADGGPTDLDNLILLCGAHHRFIHSNDWCITRAGISRWDFRGPDDSQPRANALAMTFDRPGASAASPSRHDHDALQPRNYTGPDWDLGLCIEILHQELHRLPRPRDREQDLLAA